MHLRIPRHSNPAQMPVALLCHVVMQGLWRAGRHEKQSSLPRSRRRLVDTDDGDDVANQLDGAGLAVRLNEPYSGKAGLIYSVDLHAAAHQRRAVEIEVRQDLAVDPQFRRKLSEILGGVAWS